MTAGTITAPLTVAEAQAIAETVVGPVAWKGEEGFCACPGAPAHTTATTSTDAKVVCLALNRGGTILAPGIYCFHDSCKSEVDTASFDLRSALGKRSPSTAPRATPRPLPVRRPEPVFDPAKLATIAAKLPGADAAWFAARSRKRVDNRTPASFLHELYRPGERVLIFDAFTSQGQADWQHKQPPFDAGELDSFRTGKPCGVWFLSNPVSGEYVPNDSGKPSRRSWQTVTAWRYLVLESDKADPTHWLCALAQMPLAIAAIYTSGGKSVHALLRIDAGSKAEWDAAAAMIKPPLITLGADRKAISAVRLTRLPCCERLGTLDAAGEYRAYPEPRQQRLLYLNGSPNGTPICEQEVTAK